MYTSFVHTCHARIRNYFSLIGTGLKTCLRFSIITIDGWLRITSAPWKYKMKISVGFNSLYHTLKYINYMVGK